MIDIAECFGPTSTRNRESACKVAIFEASLKLSAMHKRMQKSRVKAISGSNGIDAMRLNGSGTEAVSTATGGCTARTEFHHNEGYDFRQLIQSFIQVGGVSDPLCFSLVRKKHIHERQDLLDSTLPFIGRIVVGVERYRQARCF